MLNLKVNVEYKVCGAYILRQRSFYRRFRAGSVLINNKRPMGIDPLLDNIDKSKRRQSSKHIVMYGKHMYQNTPKLY